MWRIIHFTEGIWDRWVPRNECENRNPGNEIIFLKNNNVNHPRSFCCPPDCLKWWARKGPSVGYKKTWPQIKVTLPEKGCYPLWLVKLVFWKTIWQLPNNKTPMTFVMLSLVLRESHLNSTIKFFVTYWFQIKLD